MATYTKDCISWQMRLMPGMHGWFDIWKSILSNTKKKKTHTQNTWSYQ